MNLIRFNPVRDMYRMREQMDRIFNQMPSREFESEDMPEVEWSPRVDISETETDYVLKADLAGLTKDDIKITLQDDVLTLRGEKKTETREEGKTYHLTERAYGKFVRSFKLQTPIKKDKIDATFKNGVLILMLPKAEEAKPKEIEIKMD